MSKSFRETTKILLPKSDTEAILKLPTSCPHCLLEALENWRLETGHSIQAQPYQPKRLQCSVAYHDWCLELQPQRVTCEGHRYILLRLLMPYTYGNIDNKNHKQIFTFLWAIIVTFKYILTAALRFIQINDLPRIMRLWIMTKPHSQVWSTCLQSSCHCHNTKLSSTTRPALFLDAHERMLWSLKITQCFSVQLNLVATVTETLSGSSNPRAPTPMASPWDCYVGHSATPRSLLKTQT